VASNLTVFSRLKSQTSVWDPLLHSIFDSHLTNLHFSLLTDAASARVPKLGSVFAQIPLSEKLTGRSLAATPQIDPRTLTHTTRLDHSLHILGHLDTSLAPAQPSRRYTSSPSCSRK
jgi:hypothetical protein